MYWLNIHLKFQFFDLFLKSLNQKIEYIKTNNKLTYKNKYINNE